MKRETGVRSLRSMFEEVLLDIRYEIGSRKGERIVITDDYAQQRLSRREGGDRRKRDSA
jgi:ATP-dependent protease Clp ATPase subunit